MKLPNIIIKEILELILDQELKIEYIVRFVKKYTGISKQWNSEIFPKLKAGLIFFSSASEASTSDIKRVLDSKIQFTVRLRIEDQMEQFYSLLIDHVHSVSCHTITNRDIQRFPNLKMIDISVYGSNSNIQDLDSDYILQNNIFFDIFYCVSVVDDSVTRSIFHTVNVQTMFMMFNKFDFDILFGCQCYSTITSLTLFSTTLHRVEYLWVILENLKVATTLDIDEILFEDYESDLQNQIARKIMNLKISNIIDTLTLVYADASSISFNVILLLLKHLPALTKLTIRITNLVIDTLCFLEQTKSMIFIEFKFSEIQYEVEKIFPLNLMGNVSVKYFSLPSLLLPYMKKEHLESQLFNEMISLTILTKDEKNYDPNLFIESCLPSLSLLAFHEPSYDEDDDVHVYMDVDKILKSLLKNTYLTSLALSAVEFRSCVDILELKLPNIKEFTINYLYLTETDDFNTIVKLLQSDIILEKFQIDNINRHNCNQLQVIIDILQYNTTLISLNLPFSSKNLGESNYNQQLDELSKLLQSKENVIHLLLSNSPSDLVDIINKHTQRL
ncbi:hypothetical protein DLAC_06003 [Tieghemostelium lacteum]|uniref:Uncharacterized protein n=1 Tax=Tieghemostelium lacteum TaxID=361077 RepID=A0A151ZH87_TIELA|nr:hypothetical protein DLAC_06003 [Tieghemostelium lacteum]|eukprot:KYQ93333.1 hypothetical protein DLAC_06003 [Tieghemostelium lacteum]